LLNPALKKALRNEFVRHSALVFGATMATNVLNYLFNFALSRRLGVENYATLASLNGGLMILCLPGTIANLVVVKYAAEFHAVGDTGRLSRLTRMVLLYAVAIAAAFFLGGFTLRGFAGGFLRIPNDASIGLAVLLLALSFVLLSIRGILQGCQDFRRFSISAVLEVLLKVLFAVAFVYAGYGVPGAMLGWSVATGVALLYTVWAVRRGVSEMSGAKLSLDLTRLFKTTSGVGAATAALVLLSFLDVVLVKHYLDARQAGLYAAVNLTGKIVLFIVSFLPLTLLPKVAAKAKRGEAPTGLLVQAAVGTVVLSGVTLTVFALMPGTIVSLLAGRAFAGAAPYVFRYDIAMMLLAGITLIVNYKIALHRFDFVYPLFLILLAELSAIATWHRGIMDVVNVLVIGNAVALIAVMYRIGAMPPARDGVARVPQGSGG